MQQHYQHQHHNPYDIQYLPASTAHISNVALAAANVKRWNLESLGGRLMDIVRNNLCTCLRPWTPRIKENMSRAKKMMFASQDDIKFTVRCKERVSTNLSSLRMIINDAEMESKGKGANTIIPEDIYVLATDVIIQSTQFITLCDQFIELSDTLSKGTPTKIHRTLTPRMTASRELHSAFMTTMTTTTTYSPPYSSSKNVGSNYLDLVYNNSESVSVSSRRKVAHELQVSPKTFAETSNPRPIHSSLMTGARTKRATTPTASFSSPPKPMKIPDLHNSHIPVEVVLWKEKLSDDDAGSGGGRRYHYGDGHREYSKRHIQETLDSMMKNDSKNMKKCHAPDPRAGDFLVETNRLSPRQRSTIEHAVSSMITARPELSDEDRLWLVATLRRLKIDDELSNPY